MRFAFKVFFTLGLTGLLLSPWVAADSDTNTTAASAPDASASPNAIPLPEIPAKTESASSSLRDIQAQSAVDPVTKSVITELPSLKKEIESRHEESSKILNTAPTLELLRSLERDWKRLSETLDNWSDDLKHRANDLGNEITQLSQLEALWTKTLELAQGLTNTPPDVLAHIKGMVDSIVTTRRLVEKQRAQVLTLQNQVADLDARVDQAMAAVRHAKEQALGRLFDRDSPPLWSGEVRSRAGLLLITDSRASLVTQLQGLYAYADRRAARFGLHVGIFFILLAAIYWARPRVRPWLAEEPSISRAVKVLERPAATALLLAMFASSWIYPQPPRLMWAIIGAAGLVPAILLLRRILDPYLYPVLNGLMVFYFVDRLRLISAALPVLSRFIFVGECVAAIVFLIWLLQPSQRRRVPESNRAAWEQVEVGIWIALGIFGVALLANVVGYVGLANLLGNAALRSGYLAVMLYAILGIVDVFVMFPLRVGPIAHLGLVQRHRPMLWSRIRWVLQRAALLFWMFATLELLAIRGPIFDVVRRVLTATLHLGSISLSLDRLFYFLATLWAAVYVSRFVRFILEEDVYPRVDLGRGIPYAISTVLHYALLSAGFVVALGALGIDMTKFTILAGAFGVGLGFGLQTILNNFFSGLILLFERPIKVGDVIELAGATGVVEHIGIRASTIRTTSGSDVIIPNGNLISNPVTNWTFSAHQRALELPVSTVSTADPARVIQIMDAVAKSNDHLSKTPPPRVLFVKSGVGSMDFELHASTNRVDDWLQVRSDLTLAINAALAKENLALK